ncbi:MAG: right-handed parallel beta-helix repeat-containing protein [Sedimentisphaerales bacterium]|nr:right-handed parallel beta-helix repeat-containing protein [Sedimentisphaerales bacterium]
MSDFKNFVLHDGGDLSYGGGYDPTVTDYSSVHDGNGGPVVSQVSGCSYSSGTITSTGDALEDAVAGVFAYVVFTGSLSGYTDYYVVASCPDENTITIAGGPSGSDNCNVTVGGFWPSTDAAFQQALDTLTSESQLHIATDQDSGTTVSVGVQLSSNTEKDGTATGPIIIKGVNSENGADLDRTCKWPVLQATADMANMLLIQNRYLYVSQLHFDGNGKTITNGIQINDYYSHVRECLVEDVDTCGILMNFLGNQAVGCEVWDVPGTGIYINASGQAIINCSIHECGGGIYAVQYGQNCFGNRVFNNSGDGIVWRSHGGLCANNICANNNRGIYFYASEGSTVVNNSCINNTLYGFLFWSANVAWTRWGNNHSYNNGTAHCNRCDDEDWPDFLDGNNITGNPKFMGDYTNGDYRLQAGSALLNAGWPSFWGYKTDRDAVEVFGHVGAFVPEYKVPMGAAVAGMVGSPVTGAF